MKSKLLLAAMAISACAFSQDSSFQIKDYKYRTPGFRALRLGLNFSGSYQSTNQNDVHEERLNSTSLGPVYANYYRINSTDKKIRETIVDFGVEYSSFDRKRTGEKNGNRLLSGALLWDQSTRNFRNNNWFFELGNRLQGDGRTNSSRSFNATGNGSDVFVSNTLRFGVGKGRIERVQDAQMALYILQDLAEQNLLSRSITKEEAYAFSELVTDINNRRVFDSRRRRIYELSRIDSFLKRTGLATQTDIRHFTTVNDNWAFAINPMRQNGANWFVRLKPTASLEADRFTNTSGNPQTGSRYRSLNIYLTPEIGYENFKAVSLKWQRNYGITAFYSAQWWQHKNTTITGPDETTLDFDGNSANWHLNTFYELGYFPNTRTAVSGRLGINVFYFNSDYYSLSPSLNVSMNYFIGYRTYLTGRLTSFYYATKYSDAFTDTRRDLFSGSFALQLSHVIF